MIFSSQECIGSQWKRRIAFPVTFCRWVHYHDYFDLDLDDGDGDAGEGGGGGEDE